MIDEFCMLVDLTDLTTCAVLWLGVGYGSSYWTLAQISDVYECTGRFMHDCGLMTEVCS